MGKLSEQLLIDSFSKSHQGYSSDSLLVKDELREAFVREIQGVVPNVSEEVALLKLLNLRKAGKCPRSTQRMPTYNHEEYAFAAEIAARILEDETGLTLDGMFCRPDSRNRFDAIATSLYSETSTERLRLAALKLRKARKLRPEYLRQLLDVQKTMTISPADIHEGNVSIPPEPGIYMFFSPDGVLYIGEAGNLERRLKQHLDHSDRKKLAEYLWANGSKDVSIEVHAFPKNSVGEQKKFRRAYEAELIKSRSPKFNIQGN